MGKGQNAILFALLLVGEQHRCIVGLCDLQSVAPETKTTVLEGSE